jgi:hypothetical protein
MAIHYEICDILFSISFFTVLVVVSVSVSSLNLVSVVCLHFKPKNSSILFSETMKIYIIILKSISIPLAIMIYMDITVTCSVCIKYSDKRHDLYIQTESLH